MGNSNDTNENDTNENETSGNKTSGNSNVEDANTEKNNDAESPSFLQAPAEKNVEKKAKENDSTNSELVQMEIKTITFTQADQEKVKKLISLVRNYRFDTGLKRAEIEESIGDINKNSNKEIIEIKKNIDLIKKIIKKAKANIEAYDKELLELDNYFTQKSIKMGGYEKQKKDEEQKNKAYLKNYSDQKVILEAENQELEKVRGFYVRQGLDPLNNK